VQEKITLEVLMQTAEGTQTGGKRKKEDEKGKGGGQE